MRIRHIRIENYRSIKSLDIAPRDITLLVGPNNSGKTNILCALNFLLGDRWPTRQGLEQKDWFNKRSDQEILIKVWLHPNDASIESVWFRCPGDGERAETKYSRVLSGRRIENMLSNEVRDRCALVYLDAARSFESQFGQSKWSLFGRVIRQLDEDFRRTVSEEKQSELQYHLTHTQRILKTPLYQDFEKAVQEAFSDQIQHTQHAIKLDFRTFDPLNFYKSLQPVLAEGAEEKSPLEAGSGMRNLIVLALFRAYAKTFRGQALIAVEEPEIYLHPHAQRSLASLFSTLAEAGAQLFVSTHSAAFIDISHSDRVALVDRCPDDDEEVCTSVRMLTTADLIARRRIRYPSVEMTEASMRARYRSICGVDHAEAFFARAILLVEGPSEVDALPIYARACGAELDALNISVVPANGKNSVDALFDLYEGHGIPVFVMFDNDRGGKPEDIRANRVITRMLDMPEADMPDGAIGTNYCVVEGNFEALIRAETEQVAQGLYDVLVHQAQEMLGPRAGKPLIARYVANELVSRQIVPPTARRMVVALRGLLENKETAGESETEGKKTDGELGQPRQEELEDDIPF